MRKQHLFRIVAFLAVIGIAVVPVRAQSTWTDPATGLMWTHQDNGANVNWTQARDYCANLQLGGYSGWRLPALEELKTIYDKTQTVDMIYNIKGGIHLTRFLYWTSSPGRDSSEAMAFSFMLGQELPEKLSLSSDSDISLGALCMRHP